jgi:hypothetical protein
MGRKPRLEFPGALYHVLNGSPAADTLFRTGREAQAFVDSLTEACQRLEWRLHAYCLLPGSYQLALETPRPNLVQGVHWLQSTYSNRGSGARRRLFRGRYRAILVEPGRPWAQVIDHIHLSPVRTGVVTLAQLPQFRWSSLKDRADGPAYVSHLAGLLAAPGRAPDPALARLGQGWVHGSQAYRRERLDQLRAPAGVSPGESERLRWSAALEAGARFLHRDLNRAPADPKSAPWKVALAAWLQGRTGATNRWLGEHLQMGPPDAVSRYIGEMKRGQRPEAGRLAATLPARPSGP